jgi:hypothetical protein
MTYTNYELKEDVENNREILIYNKPNQLRQFGAGTTLSYTNSKFKDRTGETSIANNGQLITIIKYRNSADLDIQFEDGAISEHRRYQEFITGIIKNPNEKIDHLGETAIAYNGQQMKIVRYRNTSTIDVEFEDGTVVKNRTYNSFLTGHIRNPNNSIRKKEQCSG